VHDFPPDRPRHFGALALAVVVFFSSSCGGGIRPTLTDERLGDAAAIAAAPTAVAPTIASTAEPAETAQAAVSETGAGEPVMVDGVEQLVVQVIEEFPHDGLAYTQGLELLDGAFIESTGQRPSSPSTLRRVVPQTGEVIQSVATPNGYFGEGATVVGDQIIQLTWQTNTAYYWDATTFELRKEVAYAGEGWGLCYDGARLIMTDGGTELIFRDPASFDEIGRIAVSFRGQPVAQLNELECVNGVVWANIYPSRTIVRVDPASGMVTGIVDTSAINPNVALDSEHAMNGIAWDAATSSFFVTGKFWPTLYRINFVPPTPG